AVPARAPPAIAARRPDPALRRPPPRRRPGDRIASPARGAAEGAGGTGAGLTKPAFLTLASRTVLVERRALARRTSFADGLKPVAPQARGACRVGVSFDTERLPFASECENRPADASRTRRTELTSSRKCQTNDA